MIHGFNNLAFGLKSKRIKSEQLCYFKSLYKERHRGYRDSESKKKKTAFDILLGEESNLSNSNSFEIQFTQFLGEKSIPHDDSVSEWWKINGSQFPDLGFLARSFLCIPATLTPSEHLFSTAGLTVTRLRNSLKPKNIDALLF